MLQRVVYSKFSILVLLALFILASKAAFHVQEKYRDVDKKKERARRELTRLEERQEALAVEIERLGTRAGVEEEIREKFGLAKEGEKLVVIIDDEDDEKVEPVPELSFFDKIKNKISGFFGKN